MSSYKPGQRWISQTELELGLGRIVSADGRMVVVDFPAANEKRTYRAQNAPLQRFLLNEGDLLRSERGDSFLVQRLEEDSGVVTYFGKGKKVSEEQLHPRMNARRDNLFERLTLNQMDSVRHFQMRQQAQTLRSRWLRSPVRGMIGPRVDLIPHQYYICHRACSSMGLPRLMLSDEVGLGKTIEAGMIWHALRQRGRVVRTLILVPESLKHQWIVEMLRRFNQFFTLVDEGYIQGLAAAGDRIENPFRSRNEMLCTLEYLLEEPALTRDLLQVSWDLVIIDEAHHLVHEGDFKSPQYLLANAISARTKGLLLLTGTPLQLHPEAHFNRLRLLDPTRFVDFGDFLQAQEQYHKLVKELNQLVLDTGNQQTQLTWDELYHHVPEHSSIRTWLENVSTHSLDATEWIRRIVDALGTGSVVFRNSRRGVGGFPKRLLKPYALPPHEGYRLAIRKVMEAYPDQSLEVGINGLMSQELPEAWILDERVIWLKTFLRDMEKEKVLLICSDREVVRALQQLLPSMIGSENFVVFHEDLDLVARDRAAAWFARRDGARVLVTSEIGSEGRNFQFAHHLVLFDLPLDAALLEQRIGRLDRIGQREQIHIHVPYCKGSALDVLFRWYHDGLDAFLHPLMGSGELYLEYEGPLLEAVVEPGLMDHFMHEVLPEVHQKANRMREEVEQGRDQLLEFNSRNPQVANDLVNAVDEMDASRELHDLVLQALDEFGVDIDDGVLPQSLVLHTTPEMKTEIPGLSDKTRIISSVPSAGSGSEEKHSEIGITVTKDRHEALDQDAVDFFSWEHPTTQGVLEMLTMEEFGTASCAMWVGAPDKGLILQCNFMHDPVLSNEWGLSDLAGPELISVLVDAKGDVQDDWLEPLQKGSFKNASLPQGPALQKKIQQFASQGLAGARKHAQARSNELVRDSLERVTERLDREYQRASYLLTLQGKKEDSAFLTGFRKRIVECKKAVMTPQLRLDSIRLLVCRP